MLLSRPPPVVRTAGPIAAHSDLEAWFTRAASRVEPPRTSTRVARLETRDAFSVNENRSVCT